jgi:PhzF family phenazine biosynthesis protein
VPVPFYWVDAFADRPFGGNPAAVCFLDAGAPDAWMQEVAAEIGLSETAFLVAGQGALGLRWFTPTTEVDLCGHATLASAHALWHSGRLAPDARAEFDTRSGRLTAQRQAASELIWLDFPSTPPVVATTPQELLDALGLEDASFVGRSRFDYLLEVDAADTVRRIQPDFDALRGVDTRGVIVTARADAAADGADFVSRFFAPAAGVDEDPVTGSAHCALAPYWADCLGRATLTGRQLSARGGTVHVRLEGDRVGIGGRAATVLEGTLHSHPD